MNSPSISFYILNIKRYDTTEPEIFQDKSETGANQHLILENLTNLINIALLLQVCGVY